jgi:HTH-type transcriptional regulator/antitoxin HipB
MVIRQRRQQLGLGQQVLADRVGVSRQWIVEIERGKPRAEIGLVLRTLDAVNLRIDIPLDGETGRPPTGRSVGFRGGSRDIDIDALIRRARGLP